MTIYLACGEDKGYGTEIVRAFYNKEEAEKFAKENRYWIEEVELS
jgi:hypothetical protein